MAVAVDCPKVGRFVRSAVGQGHDVVNLMSLTNPREPDALVAPAQVLIALHHLVTKAPPWTPTTP